MKLCLCPSGPEPTAPAPTRKPVPKDVRLPLNVHPQHYDVQLRPDIYGDDPGQFNFSGSVDIHVNCTRQTDTITLHTKQLDILRASIEIQMGSGVSEEQSPKCVSWKEDKLREFLILSFDKALKPNFLYKLTIDFNGRIKRNLIGIYLSSYKQNNVTK
ncbi:hypothetical protein NP493_315g04044 [Ridgeia piscesae]|uniref:Aminopeptidase N-like N-terminal domain-containing protein n=1 Tax=Ridgeia piscesae TaxID=27915 RepID=A0AAD9L6V6_RIDPI|nr:hypothetical protein NP493_315g04044 [Ridgeia piscesae]